MLELLDGGSGLAGFFADGAELFAERRDGFRLLRRQGLGDVLHLCGDGFGLVVNARLLFPCVGLRFRTGGDVELIREVRPSVIIPEIEAVSTEALEAAEAGEVRIVPCAHAVAVCMDRCRLRRLAAEKGVPTSPFAFATTEEQILSLLRHYFATHTCLTRRDLQRVAGLRDSAAKKWLRRLTATGVLQKDGASNAPVYLWRG